MDEIMTTKEVAEYLRLCELTVQHHVRDGKIPGSRVGGVWRFMRAQIDEWLENGGGR